MKVNVHNDDLMWTVQSLQQDLNRKGLFRRSQFWAWSCQSLGWKVFFFKKKIKHEKYLLKHEHEKRIIRPQVIKSKGLAFQKGLIYLE